MVPQVVIVILRDGLICITVPRSQQFTVIAATAAADDDDDGDDDYYPIRGNLRSLIVGFAFFFPRQPRFLLNIRLALAGLYNGAHT